MRRRSFVQLTAIGTAALGVSGCSFSDNAKVSDSLLPYNLKSILNPEEVTRIGEIYLSQFPKENSRRKLSDLLLKDIPTNGDTTRLLSEKMAQDYADQRIITLDGWILSHTEARQCALFSLTSPK